MAVKGLFTISESLIKIIYEDRIFFQGLSDEPTLRDINF